MAKNVNKAKPASKPAARVAGGKNYAGFLVRFGAALIDGLATIILGLFVPFGGLIVLAANIYLIQKEGYSIGKKVLNLRIIKEDGKMPTLVDAIIREIVGKFLSAIFIGLGFLLIIVDERKQGLHDKIAKTFVVKA